MKRIMKKCPILLFCVALGSTFNACGHKTEPQIQTQDEAASGTESETSEIKIESPGDDNESEVLSPAATETAAPESAVSESAAPVQNGYRIIESQTFEVTLEPLGKVTFVSYEPDGQQSSLEDALFEIQKDGRTIAALEGMYEDNIRANEMLNGVEAVSFPDYNSDGYSDIIILCSYSPASGAETGEGYSEARIYSGSADGAFTLERTMSEAANSAVAEKSIQSVLGFIGAGKKAPEAAGWKQAYIDTIQQDTPQWRGYHLIYVNDDEIPELIKMGDSEAAGCAIVTYVDGTVDEVHLSRFISYIERGNLLCNSDGRMDHYYDLVYSIKDGRLTQIGAGYYGVEDSSDIKLDENGFVDFTYHYKWNDSEVTEEEYNQALNAVYDIKKAKSGYDWNDFYTKEEAMKAISDIEE